MKKFLPILVVGILALSGLGAVAFNVNISKDVKQTSFFDELDQSQTVMTENAAVPVGNVPIPDNPICVQVAQSFIPTKEVLTRVELFIGKNSTATYPLAVSIREELAEDDLTVIDIDPSQVPTETYDWVEIDFDDITVTTGLTYYVVALTENVTDNYYAWGANNISESYPDGCAWFSIDEGDTWTNESASSYPSTSEAFNNQGAQPIFGDVVTWDMCFKTYGRDNQPPQDPLLDGPLSGSAGTSYEYEVITNDPDGDDLYYILDWADGTPEETIGPHPNGQTGYASHTWTEEGTYIIKAKARDIYGAESNWVTLEVTMPRIRSIQNPFLQRILQIFPNAFPILRNLFGL